VCVELLIEGCVQGAFTWACVKSLIAGHLDMSVSRHSKALDRILGDLQQKIGWIDQVPVLHLSAAAKPEDLFLATEGANGARGSLRVHTVRAVSCRSAPAQTA